MYQVRLQPLAEKFLKKMDVSDQKGVIKRLRSLEQNSKLGKPLTSNLTGLWSLRFGKYRAIYKINEGELIIFILDINHRAKVY